MTSKEWNKAKDYIACETRAGTPEEIAMCTVLAIIANVNSGADPANSTTIQRLVQCHRRVIGADVCCAPM